MNRTVEYNHHADRRKIVFMFPGIGSHYVGMGKTFYDNFKTARDTFEEAGDVLKLDLVNMCFTPTEKIKLDKLENAQVALVTVSIAAYRVYMQEIGIKPHYCVGHSLGEYSALCSANVIPFPDVLKIVRQRGFIINETASAVDGTMAWVINLDSRRVEEVCEEISRQGEEVYVSAYDSPTQSSISGRTDALMTAAKKLEEAGAIVYPLKFSGPFHTPLMKPAAEKMKEVLRQYQFKPPVYSVIANQDVQPYTTTQSVMDNLSLQLIQPIRWKPTIDYLTMQGVDTAVEIGPKNVLKFLVKKNTGSMTPYALDNKNDLEVIQNELIISKEEFLSIIGRCLGIAVSCKNHNYNNDEYEEYVIKPYKKIETLYTELEANGDHPKLEHVEEAVKMLRSVFNIKQVPAREQQERFEQLWRGKVLNSLKI